MSGSEISRRALLGGMAAAPFVHSVSAQGTWPNRSVQVMVPYPPAGGADTTARILYAKVGTILGQQFVIENRGGAGGTIGEALVAKAAPDGYTILHDGTAYSVNGTLYSDLPFDYNRDFDPFYATPSNHGLYQKALFYRHFLHSPKGACDRIVGPSQTIGWQFGWQFLR
jgi:tripartite-type tricarboxylate transporter receptor subunit TctC